MINPKFYLDFVSATLNPIIGFTRALGTATVTNADGSVSLVSADTPRFNYANGVCQGLLIEETRTNLLGNSAWSGAATGAPGTPPTSWLNVQTTGSISAIGAASYAAGNALTFTCVAQRRAIYQRSTVLANTTYIVSFDLDVLSGSTQMYSVFDFRGAPAGSVFGSFTLNGVVRAGGFVIPIGKHKYTLSITTGGTAGTLDSFAGLGIQGNDTAVASISNIQLEVGSEATSYIPTTTTALTRNADVATITGTNFSDFWQATRGGVLVRALPSIVSGIRPLVQFDDNTADNIIALRGNTTNPELYIKATTDQAQLDAGTIAANTAYSLTGWWATDDCKARKDSGAVVTDTTATIPTVTQMRIGSDGTNYLNGTIATIGYYDSFFGRPIYTRRKNKVFASLL